MQTAHKILGALWVFQVVNYIDRVAISFAAPSIMKSLSMSHESFGLVLSAFSVGYMLSQIPGGMLADRWGTRPLMVVTPLLWALLTGMTGLVSGLTAFIIVRIAFGLSEGLSNTCGHKTIGDNFTSRQRTTAVACWASAFAIAPIMAGPIVGSVLESFGWRAVFLALALPAIAVSIICYIVIPQQATKEKPKSDTEGALFTILKKPGVWVIGFAYLCFNIAYWGYLGWMPSYLSSTQNIDIKHLGFLGAIPYVFALLGLIVIGRLGGTLFYRFRPQMLSSSYILAAAALYFAYSAETLTGSLTGLSAAAFFLYGSLTTFGAIVLELAPERGRGTYSAVVTTLGQIGGVIAPGIIGYLVSASGSFAWGFAFMAGGLVFASILLMTLIPMIAARSIISTPLPNYISK